MAGGGFQSHTIAVDDVPGHANATHDDPHDERADRKQTIVQTVRSRNRMIRLHPV